MFPTLQYAFIILNLEKVYILKLPSFFWFQEITPLFHTQMKIKSQATCLEKAQCLPHKLQSTSEGLQRLHNPPRCPGAGNDFLFLSLQPGPDNLFPKQQSVLFITQAKPKETFGTNKFY